MRYEKVISENLRQYLTDHRVKYARLAKRTQIEYRALFDKNQREIQKGKNSLTKQTKR